MASLFVYVFFEADNYTVLFHYLTPYGNTLSGSILLQAGKLHRPNPAVQV